MSEEMIENNKISIIDEIVSEPTSSHEASGEDFYMVDVTVRRFSGQEDILPLMVPECLLDMHRNCSGGAVEAIDQFRSYSHHEGIRNRLELSVSIREIRSMEEFTDYTKINRVSLNGYIHKPPVYHGTPLG